MEWCSHSGEMARPGRRLRQRRTWIQPPGPMHTLVLAPAPAPERPASGRGLRVTWRGGSASGGAPWAGPTAPRASDPTLTPVPQRPPRLPLLCPTLPMGRAPPSGRPRPPRNQTSGQRRARPPPRPPTPPRALCTLCLHRAVHPPAIPIQPHALPLLHFPPETRSWRSASPPIPPFPRP